tara:strand:- start:207 stop:398 length:192 start_codon:yes stop_codon:yes gene_type:complete
MGADMDIWIVCDNCSQRQVATDAWLTCVFCAETLKEHPYFRRIDGKVDHEATEEVENEVFRAP